MNADAINNLLLLRADATKSGGAGHVVRCMAIAEAWRELGGEAHFVSRTAGTFVEESLDRSGFSHTEPDFDQDAAFLAQTALELKAGWTVLDGYAFDLAYEQTVKARWTKGRLAVVDDRLRPSVADMYVVPSSPVSKDAVISPGPTQLLGGLDYALLRRDFRQGNSSATPGKLRILVVLGGTDATGLADRIAKSLESCAKTNKWNIRIISPQVPSVAREGLTFIASSDGIAGELRAANVVVCTASTVALEACACGTPQILFVVADNQIPVARALCDAGAAIVVADPETLIEALDQALDPAVCERMAAQAAKLVDGKGALRMVTAMHAFDFHLRPVCEADARSLFEWSNDPAVRNASFNSSTIEWPGHLAWLGRRLSDQRTWMHIAEDTAGVPFGVLRLQSETSDLHVLSISIAASHRGLGLGPRVLRAGCRQFLAAHPGSTIRAEVKRGNIASARAFVAAGFVAGEAQADREIFLLKHV